MNIKSEVWGKKLHEDVPLNLQKNFVSGAGLFKVLK